MRTTAAFLALCFCSSLIWGAERVQADSLIIVSLDGAVAEWPHGDAQLNSAGRLRARAIGELTSHLIPEIDFHSSMAVYINGEQASLETSDILGQVRAVFEPVITDGKPINQSLNRPSFVRDVRTDFALALLHKNQILPYLQSVHAGPLPKAEEIDVTSVLVVSGLTTENPIVIHLRSSSLVAHGEMGDACIVPVSGQVQRPSTMPVDPCGLSTDTVVLETSAGVIRFRFYSNEAPVTVARVSELIKKGFYDGLMFHRVVPGFVIQGGDPLGTGTGGSGLKLKAEFNARHHVLGTIAMARGANPDSADSQFYIALTELPYLDHSDTVFGQVVSGLDVVRRIKVGDVITNAYLERAKPEAAARQ